MKFIFIPVAIIGVGLALLLPSAVAVAKLRSCGSNRYGQVVVLKGPVKCRMARRVFAYAGTHHQGNGPGSPNGWECFRIAGDPHWLGMECISPPGAERHPRNFIQDRTRR